MKDYTFSEMLEICREYDDCAGCPFEAICQNGIASVSERDIEPRDMIELPCKIPYIKAIKLTDGWVVCGKCWHKLARAYGEGGGTMWLLKCQSCKAINRYNEREDNEQGKRD